MILQIITPDGSQQHEATAVFLPGAAGAFEVLRHHAPLISTLSGGEIRWRDSSGSEHSLPVGSGAVMVENDVIKVCAE
jgi:F-type H+-transporting ATPase subunit epsilon